MHFWIWAKDDFDLHHSLERNMCRHTEITMQRVLSLNQSLVESLAQPCLAAFRHLGEQASAPAAMASQRQERGDDSVQHCSQQDVTADAVRAGARPEPDLANGQSDARAGASRDDSAAARSAAQSGAQPSDGGPAAASWQPQSQVVRAAQLAAAEHPSGASGNAAAARQACEHMGCPRCMAEAQRCEIPRSPTVLVTY